MNRGLIVRQIFFNVDMRGGEHGVLKQLLKDAGIDKDKLPFGMLVFCINRAGNALKIVTVNGIFYQKLPKGQSWDFGIPERWNQAMKIACKSLNLKITIPDITLRRAARAVRQLNPPE